MNPITVNAPSRLSGIAAAGNRPGFLERYGELMAWTIVLILVNFPLINGNVNVDLLYLPQSLDQGQWWRLITYPLVHLSWYHFMLDAGAFLLLYHGLYENRLVRKLLLISICSAASLFLGIVFGAVQTVGLSGLSGVAHGLMAFTSLEALGLQGRSRRWGLLGLAVVVTKSLYELAVGHVVFEFMHLGLCGYPIAACHAGGVLGGLIVFGSFYACDAAKGSTRSINGTPPAVVYRKATVAAVRFIIRGIIRTFYRLLFVGIEGLPASGPAVLVCNHVSYVDALIIATACPRPVRFVMHAEYFRLPILNWFFRMARVIPIDSGRRNPHALRRALTEIDTALSHGELVCLFPEGQLTRNGAINPFRPGIEKIIQRRPTPVVPMALCGLWGSFFSHKGGPAFRHWPRRIRAKVELAVGPILTPAEVTAQTLQTRISELRGVTA